jgi:hypothetical protein
MENRWCRLLLFTAFLATATPLPGAEGKSGKQRVPTHADAAVILAKFSGLFDRYVSEEATLTDCVAFLNKTGIYFGLMEVVNGKDFTVRDCARVMGQIELVFSGEAEYVAGKVKLPKDIDSWEDFCIMNGVKFVDGYRAIVQALVVADE